jgi:hypothetical protein
MELVYFWLKNGPLGVCTLRELGGTIKAGNGD